MTATMAPPAPSLGAPFRRPRALLVGMHVPFVAFTLLASVTGLGFAPEGTRWEAAPLALTVGAIQLRHSLAAAEGRRPRWWPLSLAALVVLMILPLPSLGERWNTCLWYLIASSLMLLPRPAAWVAAAACATAMGVRGAVLYAAEPPATLAWELVYSTTIMLCGGGALYWAARLVWHVDALRDARAGLAELAVERERQRVSRDLHDLLGQSLSAVSLKGDLAIGLLGREQVAPAAAEIEGLVAVARSALHDLRGVAHREVAPSFASELSRAVELLSAAGIDARVAAAHAVPPPPVDELFAWALREGVTNVLRHSAATACDVRVTRRGGAWQLEIANDGAAPASEGGHGLSGLAARAAALGGTARGRRADDGGFALVVTADDVREGAA